MGNTSYFVHDLYRVITTISGLIKIEITWGVYLFICGLYSDVISSSDYRMNIRLLNDRMINEQSNELERIWIESHGLI